MGLFDSIRRVVGGGQSDTEAESATEDDPPELVDTRDLDPADLRERAENVAGKVDQLDFSLSSLEQFDAAIEAGYDDDLHTSDRPETYDRDVVRFGCYLGEVLVRVYGGEWTDDDGWGVVISGPDDSVTVSVFEVALRSIQTDPVFAAVTDRAAAEVGLDGTVDPTAVPTPPEETATAAEPAGTDTETADAGDAGDDTVPSETPTDGTADTSTTDETAADDGDETVPAIDDTDPDTGGDSERDSTQARVPSGPEDIGTPDQSGFEFGQSKASDEGTAGPSDTEAVGETADDDTAPDDDGTRGQTVPSGVTAPSGTPTGTDDGGPADSGITDTDADTDATDSDTADTDATDAADDRLTDTGDARIDGASPPAADEQTADDADSTADGTAYTNPFEAATEQTAPDDETAPAESDDTSPADEGVSGLVDEAEPDREPSERDDQQGADADDSLFADSTSTDEPAASEPTGDSADPTPDPTEGDGLRAEYAEEAEGFVNFWNEHGLDYTPESLERLDALVAAEWDDERFADATFGSEETFDDRAFTSVATELGSYFGEVLVRELDAEWSDATANDGVVVEGVDGPLAIPVFRVAGTSLRQAPVFAKSYESLLDDIQG